MPHHNTPPEVTVPEIHLEAADMPTADASAGADTEKKSIGGLKAPAKVLVYHESWDNIDLEQQAGAVPPNKPPGHVAWCGGKLVWRDAVKKVAAVKEAAPQWLDRRRMIIIAVLLAVAVLALGLGVGLGTKQAQTTAGFSMQAAGIGRRAGGSDSTTKASGSSGSSTNQSGGKGKAHYQPRPAVGPLAVLPTLTGADVDDAAQLNSLLQIKSYLDPEGVFDDVWSAAKGKDRGYCKWKYVTCDPAGEVVTKVNLTTDSYVMVLSGSLPPAAAFSGLPGLREIDIRMNALKGGLPADWSELSGQLEVIRLDQNFINGSLPESWSALRHLKELTLWDNQLTGTLPEGYADLVTLEVLDLSYNNLEGPLPLVWSTIGSQGKGLQQLFLDVNQLTGPLPEAYAAFTKLEKLLVSENRLTGPLPDIGASWENLKELWAEYNGFEGQLPESWGKMTHLEKLAVNDNAFKGTVPASWGNMKSLADLYLYNNPGLTGCVPASIRTTLDISPGFAIEDFVMDETSLKGFC